MGNEFSTEVFVLPSFWASALINGDTSGLDPDDEAALDKFIAYMLHQYGQCWCLDVASEENFLRDHDASRFGVLACDCCEYIFYTTKLVAPTKLVALTRRTSNGQG